MTKKKAEPGRPEVINSKMEDKILEMLIDGFKISTIATKLGITRQTIYNKRKNSPNWDEAFAEAMRLRAAIIAEETLDIADDDSNDTFTDTETGQIKGNPTAVARAKVRISTRQKLLQYYDPSKYGDRSNVDVTSDGKPLEWAGLQIIMNNGKDEENVD